MGRRRQGCSDLGAKSSRVSLSIPLQGSFRHHSTTTPEQLMSIAQEDFDDACTTIATQLRAGLEHSSFRDVTVVDSVRLRAVSRG